jgi:hypothetical protein
MPEEIAAKNPVDQFIMDEIDSVPHLEALLLLWRNRPRSWTLLQLSGSLYLDEASTRRILNDLTRRGLTGLDQDSNSWKYAESPDQDDMVDRVDKTYQAELIRVSRMIHSKQSAPIREFAKAFRFNKDGA